MSEWTMITSRPMTAEERTEYEDRFGYLLCDAEAIIYFGRLPEDGQKVLVYTRWGDIYTDTFYNDPDDGCYFVETGEMDGIIAWMPLPEPPKEDDNGAESK